LRMRFGHYQTVRCLIYLSLFMPLPVLAQSFPHNAAKCEDCHALPSKFGTSPLTVQRTGISGPQRFVPSPEGGIHHKFNSSDRGRSMGVIITGDRVTFSLVGDGYVEAINSRDIEKNATEQLHGKLGVRGVVARSPALEGPNAWQVGRFGWKSQHSSLTSASADSLRNELGVRNRLYPDEYASHTGSDPPSPFDSVNPLTGQSELDRVVAEIRRTPPPAT
jgi:Di-haem oxidoreductase, putative peroxidase